MINGEYIYCFYIFLVFEEMGAADFFWAAF
jgi:hypothetical protein